MNSPTPPKAPQTSTPTLIEDEVEAPQEAPKRKVPNRGIRKRILGNGEGDYCIYQIVGPDKDMPQGSLLPLPEIPRFESTVEAIRWIKGSGEKLVGKQIMVLRAMEIMNIRVRAQPSIEIDSKPKIVVKEANEA